MRLKSVENGKTRMRGLVLLQVGLLSIPSLAESAQKFSLQDIQEWARTGAPDALILTGQEALAESSFKIFKFSLYPRLTAQANQTYSDRALSGNAIQSSGDIANLNSGWNSAASLNLWASIYRGGSDLASYRAQEADLAAMRLRDPVARSEMALRATTLYLDLGFTRRSLARKSAALLLLARDERAIQRTFKSIGMSRAEFEAYIDTLTSLRSEVATLKSKASDYLESLRAALGKPGLDPEELSYGECEPTRIQSFEEIVGQKTIPDSSDDPQLMAEQGLRQASISYGLRAEIGSLYPSVNFRSRINDDGSFNATFWVTAPLSDYPFLSSEIRKRAAEQTRISEASFIRERSERIARKRRLFEDLMESAKYLQEIVPAQRETQINWSLAKRRFMAGMDAIPVYIKAYTRMESLESTRDQLVSRYLSSIYSLQAIGQPVKFDPFASR